MTHFQMTPIAKLVVLGALALATTSHALAAITSPPADDPDRWEFRVMLDDRKIGFHNFELQQQDNIERVNTEARFKVRVLFITAYQYSHDNTEIWKGDCLQSIESTTNDNGTRYAVSGKDSSEGFALSQNDEQAALEQSCVQTFAYWNPEILDAQKLLNAQTGKVQPVSIERHGEKDIDVSGVSIASDEYVISTPDGDITVWYAQGTGQWLGLETRADGDRVLRYEPVKLPTLPGTDKRIAGAPQAP